MVLWNVCLTSFKRILSCRHRTQKKHGCARVSGAYTGFCCGGSQLQVIRQGRIQGRAGPGRHCQICSGHIYCLAVVVWTLAARPPPLKARSEFCARLDTVVIAKIIIIKGAVYTLPLTKTKLSIRHFKNWQVSVRRIPKTALARYAVR